MTDSHHDYILEDIEHKNKIEFEINLRYDGDEEYFLLILSNLFLSSIELLYTIFPQYVNSYDISYYPIMSFILNIYFLYHSDIHWSEIFSFPVLLMYMNV